MWSLHYWVKQSDNSIEDFVHCYSLPWDLETISRRNISGYILGSKVQTASNVVQFSQWERCDRLNTSNGLGRSTVPTLWPPCCFNIVQIVYKRRLFKGVLHPWALFLKTLCIFSKNKATSDKVSYGSGQKCSKELKNHSFTSVETIVVKLQWKMCENQYFPCFEP